VIARTPKAGMEERASGRYDTRIAHDAKRSAWRAGSRGLGTKPDSTGEDAGEELENGLLGSRGLALVWCRR
jgi:hypothetical protein